MIKNETKHINANEIENITSQAKENNHYIANLDGREIHNEQEYIHAMKVHFKFPEEIPTMYDCYMDWIEDLGWLQNEGYKGFVLIIDYYKSFLEQEGPIYNYDLDDGREVKTFKEYLEIEGFNAITRYWENGIIETTAGGGTPRSFNIYLVDR